MQIIDIKPTAPTCYTTAGEWIAPTCDSLCWWHLLFPQPPFLLCLLFFDALSHHVHVFLFVGVNSEAEMASHDETATPDQPAAFERPSQLSTPIFPTHTWIPYIVGSTCLLRPWEWQIKRIGSPKGTVVCWEPLALITYHPTPSKSKSNQSFFSQNSTTPHKNKKWTYWKPICLSCTWSSLCPPFQGEQTRTC